MTSRELFIRDKILKGMNLSYNMLVDKKQKENGELYFSRNGKIVEVKACDLHKVEIKTTPQK